MHKIPLKSLVYQVFKYLTCYIFGPDKGIIHHLHQEMLIYIYEQKEDELRFYKVENPRKWTECTYNPMFTNNRYNYQKLPTGITSVPVS